MTMSNRHLKYDPNRLVGWTPKKWTYERKNESSTYKGNGHKIPGPAHTKSPASLRRKARSLARRKHA